MANKAPDPSFDAILKLVDDVMRVGTRKYEFSSEVPWFVNTVIVLDRTRSRMSQSDDDSVETFAARDVAGVEQDISAAEIISAAANAVCPEKEEGLKAIGEHPDTIHRDLRRRSMHAAMTHGNYSATSDRHWRQTRMKPFIRLTAKELYRMIHYSSGKNSTGSER